MSVLQSLSHDLAGAVERAGRSVVAIHARRRIPASGVLWRPGIVAAAHHTIHRDDDLHVTLASGARVPATLVGRDPGTDVAVLRLEAGDTPVADRAADDALRVGALVLALGRPGRDVTASLGVVSALGGEFRTWHGGRIDRLVRLDLAIYDGFSGGPLVDAAGAVLGLNTSALSRGAALALPAATVDRVVDQLLATGRVARGYLGAAMQPVQLPQGLVTQLALDHATGLMVVSVEAGGPADQAGLLIGDILVALDGTPVSDPSEIIGMLGHDRIGHAVNATLVRAGQRTALDIVVGERPAATRGRRG